MAEREDGVVEIITGLFVETIHTAENLVDSFDRSENAERIVADYLLSTCVTKVRSNLKNNLLNFELAY